MSKRKQPVIAICYDFDGTLSPGNMQEHSYFPSLEITPKEFWLQSKNRAKDQEADEILAYMRLMIEKATTDTGVKVTRSSFAEYGAKVSLFEGVEEWFSRINIYGKTQGAKIEHYIISSGIKEMIEGTPIKRYFKKIFASAFMYDQHEVAYWPAQAINYTTKTQFLFRINKGLLDAWDNSKINAFIEKDKRPVSFARMIYIGDGSTDIPCMKLVKAQGGYSIAVYQPHSRKKKVSAEKLKDEDRVNFVAPADYSEDSLIDMQVKAVIRQMVAVHAVLKGPVRYKIAESLAAPNEPEINTSINIDTPILPAQKRNDLPTSSGDIPAKG
ncbi:MAG: HAD family hydrolase [Kiritimatiellia bacterium]|jgi:hypothetical protein